MSSNKRKVLENEFSDEDFDKPRRSSLQVNLSYMSNVTDSGRGSFSKTDETITEPPNRNILSLRGKRKRGNLPSRESKPTQKKERNLPKIINIQSNINNQEQALNESCSQLRDAILRKTREIFDQGNELAIKTSQVLQEGSRMIKTVEEEFSRSLILEKDVRSVILEKDLRSVILENDMISRSVILEKDPTSRSTIPENKNSKLLEIKESKPPTKSLKSMILEMSTNTRSTLLERMKESKLIPQISENPRSSTENFQTPPGNNQDCRSPSVRVALREDQQIIMSGKNKNSDPVRINLMNSPLSKKSSELELGTPKKSRLLDLSSEKPNFPKKRLFTDENDPENGTSENNFSEAKDPLQKTFLEPSKPVSRFASPILSGSTRKRSRLSLRRTQKSQINKDSSPVKETINKGVRSTSPGYPLTCSSFIDNRNQNKNSDAAHFSGRGTNDSSCMEITAIPNILPISVRGSSCDKENSRKNVKEPLPGSQDKRVLSMELTEVEGNILDVGPLRGENPRLVEAPADVSDDERIEDVSVRTTRTSLNVNTSMDPIQGKKSEEEVCSSNLSGCRSSKQSQESLCPVHSSLQVNTSLDCVSKSRKKKLTVNEVSIKTHETEKHLVSDEGKSVPQNSDPVEVNVDQVKTNLVRNQLNKVPVKSNAVDKSCPVLNTSSQLERSSSESLENVSLLERLKCFFAKPSNARVTRNSRSSRSMNSTNGIGETSCIEGTPVPISRSYLWKSQIKQNTFASNLNFNASEESNKSVDNVGTSQKQLRKSKEIERHPALYDSELKTAHPFSQSSNKTTESNVSSRAEDSSPDNSRKPRKRKLYPLRGRSQLLSLSPAQSATTSPKRIVFPKRRKNRKWMKLKKAQKAETSLRTQKTQKTQEVRNDLDLSKSGAESAEDKSVNIPTQQSTRRKKPRKVLRKKIIIKKIASSSVVAEMERNRLKIIEPENSESGGRSSLSDFEPKKKDDKRKKISRRIIVTTGLSNDDKSLVKSIVKKLGKAEIEMNVTRKTTHVISSGVRTINLLKGIIRGCWLVSLDWVLNSLEHGDWLNPEPYEMAHFSAAVQENRKDRQLFGNAFVPELFSNCGIIYIENGTNPTSSSLKELIKAAGGQITENPAIAKIVVGSEGLKEIWILDSITTGKLQPMEQYRRK